MMPQLQLATDGLGAEFFESNGSGCNGPEPPNAARLCYYA